VREREPGALWTYRLLAGRTVTSLLTRSTTPATVATSCPSTSNVPCPLRASVVPTAAHSAFSTRSTV